MNAQGLTRFHILSSDKLNVYTSKQPDRRICGILGTIKLINGLHLVVVTHRVFVGLLNGQVIWRMAGFEIIPYIPTAINMTDTQKTQNDIYVSMLRVVLDTPFFYFSYTHDLTHTLQRLHSMPPEFLQVGLAERAESRFVWNGFLLQNFQTPMLRKYCLPVIHGCILFDIKIWSCKSSQHFFRRFQI